MAGDWKRGGVDMGMDGGVCAQLSAVLACSACDVLLWHDPQRKYRQALDTMVLPPDVELVLDEGTSAFSLKCRIENAAPDVRLLIYRPAYHDVSAGDWLAGIEARAEFFVPVVDDEDFSFAGEGRPPVPREPAPAVDAAADVFDRDWYARDEFEALVAEHMPNALQTGLDAAAQEAGYTLYFDCAVRAAWPSMAAYYGSLIDGPIVAHDAVPTEVYVAQSFKVFVYQAVMGGRLFYYDDSSWITPVGLHELDMAPADIEVFARAALALAQKSGIGMFTVPSLRGTNPELPLFAWGLSDEFYESALMSQQNLLTSVRLCGRRVFMPAGVRAKGGDFIARIVRREGSIYVDDLADLLLRGYGIEIPRSQLMALIKPTDLFLVRGINRIYADRATFIREVE